MRFVLIENAGNIINNEKMAMIVVMAEFIFDLYIYIIHSLNCNYILTIGIFFNKKILQ